MKLKDYILRTGTTINVISTRCKICNKTLRSIINNETSPSLKNAVILNEYTDGIVSFKDLLCDRDKKDIEEKKKNFYIQNKV